MHAGEHVRVFPISNWTELDVWQYIAREKLDVPSIYYAHRRAGGAPQRPARAGDAAHAAARRRDGRGSLGALPHRGRHQLHLPGRIRRRRRSRRSSRKPSVTRLTERGATRMDDQTSEASMERRKKEGYF